MLKPKAYIPASRPALKGSEQRWIEDEFKKIEASILSILAVLKEMQE